MTIEPHARSDPVAEGLGECGEVRREGAGEQGRVRAAGR
jgi:hypothetical protein